MCPGKPGQTLCAHPVLTFFSVVNCTAAWHAQAEGISQELLIVKECFASHCYTSDAPEAKALQLVHLASLTWMTRLLSLNLPGLVEAAVNHLLYFAIPE